VIESVSLSIIIKTCLRMKH